MTAYLSAEPGSVEVHCIGLIASVSDELGENPLACFLRQVRKIAPDFGATRPADKMLKALSLGWRGELQSGKYPALPKWEDLPIERRQAFTTVYMRRRTAGLLKRAHDFRLGHMSGEQSNDCADYFIVNSKDVFQVAIVAFGPAVGTSGRINQLR